MVTNKIKMNCILCNSSDVKVLEEIEPSILKEIYEQKGIKVKQFFTSKDLNLCECGSCQLLYFTPPAVGDGAFYGELQQKINGYYLKEKEDFVMAARHINSGESVLEIGCGEGNFTNYITTDNYVGLEFNEDAIAIAQKKGLNVINQSIEDFAKQNPEKYDVACYFQVLEHVPEPSQFITESLKCLKKGGKLIFAVPSEDTFLRFGVNLFLNAPPHHITRWRDAVFTEMQKSFPIKLKAVIHEKLHRIHHVFYLQCTIYESLRKILGIPFKNFVRNDDKSYSLFKISFLLSKILSPVYFLFKKDAIGQSVIVVYEKE
ncbi:Ubiquinone biosynthesis O-methyltransferase, mitochondrial [Emticicia aquatica]|uniref:Ubiquinone biosynthesis O-methyltransferase, mitochondrial n=2 Tax=Emticicia aquatica TaxID=1681835 RepID=A0ABN8EM45_9BACT|nr:Ubiquinone biosynthesis O-methyltransferase, mitochondrial [Emticicia aquatica]